MVMTIEDLDLPAGTADGVLTLIKSLLKFDPQLRPEIFAVMKHWFFNSADAGIYLFR